MSAEIQSNVNVTGPEVLTFSHLLLSPVAHADRVIAAACVCESPNTQGPWGGPAGMQKCFVVSRMCSCLKMNPLQPRKQLTGRLPSLAACRCGSFHFSHVMVPVSTCRVTD